MRGHAIVTECVRPDPIGTAAARIGDRLCQVRGMEFTLFGQAGVAWALQ